MFYNHVSNGTLKPTYTYSLTPTLWWRPCLYYYLTTVAMQIKLAGRQICLQI